MANGKKSSRKKLIVFLIIGVVVITLVALVIMGSGRENIITVQTEKVERRTITQIVTATGKIQPVTQVKINAEVSGEIVELPVREGQRVAKGQLLVRIKPDAYQAQFERAQASLTISEANLVKAEAEYKRASELYEKRLVSDAEMDIARASNQSAKASHAQAQASLKEARETLAKTTIYSPMDGVVSQLLREVAERVSGSTFTQGTEIMTVADLARMEARVDVGENDIILVSGGDTARVKVDAYTDSTFVGVVSQIANTAKTTGVGTQDQVINFEVRILLKTPPGVELRPGMSMTADIETETRQNVLAVPIQSVTVRAPKMERKEGEAEAENDAKPSTLAGRKEQKLDEVVFVVEDGQAKTVVVKRGLTSDTHVEIASVELEGKEVVAGPFRAINRELENGSKVKVENKAARRTGGSIAQQ
ncbi:MAG: efflux RND transporter periplasmic adaptor subunit [Ignavibacteriales bacterium]|nr:efflux RND transporter periplasmic adaptor subunit [Ignavibacteriales bacterium]